MFLLEWIRAAITLPLLLLLALFGVSVISGGCVIAGAHGGELYLEFGTKIALGHLTVQTTDVQDTVSIHSQPIEEWWAARVTSNTPKALATTRPAEAGDENDDG